MEEWEEAEVRVLTRESKAVEAVDDVTEAATPLSMSQIEIIGGSAAGAPAVHPTWEGSTSDPVLCGPVVWGCTAGYADSGGASILGVLGAGS